MLDRLHLPELEVSSKCIRVEFPPLAEEVGEQCLEQGTASV